ncbi:MAG TPA: diguanylate cyclase [Candidatus Dormibacteraeota bacterium]|nr:diguanylate cyclase [Candidatus Dormibacteraeota bacterium]
MSESKLSVLHIEDSPAFASLVRQYLSEITAFSCCCIQRETLASALSEIERQMPDLILLDPGLPDARDLESVFQLRAAAPEVPLVLLTGHDDEELAAQALRAGAQDYVCKGNIDSRSLARTLRYAMERHRVQSSLRTQALFDDLTGLYNHRGFRLLAEQHLKLIDRSGGRILLVSIDLDGLKHINDHFGHQEGNRALAETGEILKGCFRQSDVIGRLGGDEFAVLVTNAEDSAVEQRIRTRLLHKVEAANTFSERNYKLSLSVGIVSANSAGASLDNLAQLLARADALMYEEKRKKLVSLDDTQPDSGHR